MPVSYNIMSDNVKYHHASLGVSRAIPTSTSIPTSPICTVSLLESNTMLLKDCTESQFQCSDVEEFHLKVEDKHMASLSVQYVNTTLTNIVLGPEYKHKCVEMDYILVSVKLLPLTTNTQVWVRYAGVDTNWFLLPPDCTTQEDEGSLHSVYTSSAVYLKLCQTVPFSAGEGSVIRVGLNLHPLSFFRYLDTKDEITKRETDIRMKKWRQAAPPMVYSASQGIMPSNHLERHEGRPLLDVTKAKLKDEDLEFLAVLQCLAFVPPFLIVCDGYMKTLKRDDITPNPGSVVHAVAAFVSQLRKNSKSKQFIGLDILNNVLKILKHMPGTTTGKKYNWFVNTIHTEHAKELRIEDTDFDTSNILSMFAETKTCTCPMLPLCVSPEQTETLKELGNSPDIKTYIEKCVNTRIKHNCQTTCTTSPAPKILAVSVDEPSIVVNMDTEQIKFHDASYSLCSLIQRNKISNARGSQIHVYYKYDHIWKTIDQTQESKIKIVNFENEENTDNSNMFVSAKKVCMLFYRRD